MTELASTMLVLASLAIDPQGIPTEKVMPRFEAACTQGRWEADCPALRGALEMRLYKHLSKLKRMGMPIDRATLVGASRARFAYLAHFGLSRLGQLKSAEEKQVALAALEHPSSAVRAKAEQLLDKSGDEWREGLARWWLPRSANITVDLKPDMARFGIPALSDPQLRYRHLASDDARAVYTTQLTPAKVLDLIAKGKPVITGDKLGAPATAEQQQAPQRQAVQQPPNIPSAAEMQELLTLQKQIQEAMSRGDMKTVQELSVQMKSMTAKFRRSADPAAKKPRQEASDTQSVPDAAGIRPVTEFSSDPAQISYVKFKMARGKELIIAAGYDDAWGETTVVVIFPRF